MHPADTEAAANGRQVAIYRAMPPAQRVALAVEMSEEAAAVAAAGIRARHPDYDEAQVQSALRRLRLGDDLVIAAWPRQPLVAP